MPRKSTSVTGEAVTVETAVATPIASTEQRIAIAWPAFAGSFKRHFKNLVILKNPADAINFDMVIFPGGEDVSPRLYGEENTMSWDPNTDRDTFESEVFKVCDKNGILMYGSCRGLQLINVMRGGTLVQDLNMAGSRHPSRHDLTWEQDSKKLRPLFTSVNSLHHQGIRSLGKDLYTFASYAGIPELIFGKTILATQFHPEMMDDMEPFFKVLTDWVTDTKLKKAEKATA